MTFPPTPTGKTSSHAGNCHCGAVQFHFTLSPPLPEYPTASCNCSICSKNGYLLVYPFQKDLIIDQGAEVLKVYRFGDRKATHQFCSSCGSSCFIWPPPMVGEPITAVNVRLLKDFDPEILKINKVDGKSFQPEYKV
ncbi:GFA family protein [Aspergillus fijiensis CBS 313.89]|uniref:CENP-V/GFA domain-containing protein n=1 Tax=Aspergillus fijiensis CBS 313.89 TaxID=1448319 RepID=A0A8G1W320_9EURO|nr:uncharacterized protein BO72DRAFT_421663 [Aspergillus fijiensis CBS 313.89]RAK81273.1 hypothetical protein BO72DRAFT_421663 [Aspergillus fijiensis CBS 313.89]